MERKLAVLSISGGLDSTCLLLKLLSEGYEVKAYTFDYGQKHAIEQMKLVKNINFLRSKKFKVELQSIDLKDCFSDSQSSLCKEGVDVPTGDYSSGAIYSTVVENRNVIFASIIYGKALSLSKKENLPVEIFLGIHADDGVIYPDTTPESREACENAFKISNWGSDQVSYKAPFVEIDKTEVLAEGTTSMENLNFSEEEIIWVLKHTHSCYTPDEFGRSCGKCGTCCQRIEAFAELDRIDPIEYQ